MIAYPLIVYTEEEERFLGPIVSAAMKTNEGRNLYWHAAFALYKNSPTYEIMTQDWLRMTDIGLPKASIEVHKHTDHELIEQKIVELRLTKWKG